MKHLWTVLCSRAVIDRDSNNVSLQNVIEQLTVHDEPSPEGFWPSRMDLLSLWMRNEVDEPERGWGRLSLHAPSGEVKGQWEFEIDLTDALRTRSRLTFGGLPLSEPGIYMFNLEQRASKRHKWRLAAEVPLQVDFMPPIDEEE